MHFSACIIRDWAVETMKRISLERKDLKKMLHEIGYRWQKISKRENNFNRVTTYWFVKFCYLIKFNKLQPEWREISI